MHNTKAGSRAPYDNDKTKSYILSYFKIPVMIKKKTFDTSTCSYSYLSQQYRTSEGVLCINPNNSGMSIHVRLSNIA